MFVLVAIQPHTQATLELTEQNYRLVSEVSAFPSLEEGQGESVGHATVRITSSYAFKS